MIDGTTTEGVWRDDKFIQENQLLDENFRDMLLEDSAAGSNSPVMFKKTFNLADYNQHKENSQKLFINNIFQYRELQKMTKSSRISSECYKLFYDWIYPDNLFSGEKSFIDIFHNTDLFTFIKNEFKYDGLLKEILEKKKSSLEVQSEA